MTNDDQQPARLRSFDLTNVVAQTVYGDAADARPEDHDADRSDDSARVQR